MTIPRLDALMSYWKQQPPTHALMAGYVGYKPPSEFKIATEEELAAFLTGFGNV